MELMKATFKSGLDDDFMIVDLENGTIKKVAWFHRKLDLKLSNKY